MEGDEVRELGGLEVPNPGDLLVARGRPRTWRAVESVDGCHVHARKPNGTPHRIPIRRIGEWDVVPTERSSE